MNSPETALYRILLVDDEQNVLNALRRTLLGEPYEVDTVCDPTEALVLVNAGDYDLILSDYRMPKLDGVRLLRSIKNLRPDSIRIILSAYTDLDALVGAINEAEIYRFLNKPWEDYDLKATIAQALAHRDLLVENRRLADQVRAQRDQIDRQRAELKRLESEHPGITNVRWADDGSVILDDSDDDSTPLWATK
jgi:DNA-binding NtrC family response regulator